VSRQARLLVVVGVAVLVAGLASAGVYLAIVGRPATLVEKPGIPVVVAARPLEIGVSLTKDDVKIVEWPERSPLDGAFAKIEEVEKRGLIDAVGTNEPITATKLAPLEAGAGLPPAIKQGMRALSVRVDDVVGVAGFVVPGTKVDVLVTVSRDAVARTRVVLSNVLVLTAGTRYDEALARQEGKAIPSSVVTLMVTPAEAERITLAQTEGQIMLALRNPLDTEATLTTGVNSTALLDGPSTSASAPPVASSAPRRQTVRITPPPPVAAAVPEPPKRWTVEVIKALKVEQETQN
jgi:pilus assembly protein CpaB